MLIARKETRTPQNRLRVLDDVTALRHVQTVQELSDILVADLADLLDIGGTLGDVLERVSGQLELILLVLRRLNLNTGPHDNPSYELLADEVSDLHLPAVGLLVLLQVDVDGEMGIYVAHLVLVSLGDTDDQVVNQGADSSESSDALAGAVVELDLDDILLGVREADRQVAERLCELASGTLNKNVPVLDGDLDALGDGELFLRVDVLHLDGCCGLAVLSRS